MRRRMRRRLRSEGDKERGELRRRVSERPVTKFFSALALPLSHLLLCTWRRRLKVCYTNIASTAGGTRCDFISFCCVCMQMTHSHTLPLPACLPHSLIAPHTSAWRGKGGAQALTINNILPYLKRCEINFANARGGAAAAAAIFGCA